MGLPVFLQSCLWSYDISVMDKDESKKLIITQIINYGNKKQLEWMEGNYTSNDIREVVMHPSRGVWWRDRLRIWLKRFGVIIDPLRFELAVREITLRPTSLYNAFWERVDRDKNAITRRYT